MTEFAADEPAILVQFGERSIRLAPRTHGSKGLGEFKIDTEYKKKAIWAMAAARRRGLDYADGAFFSGEAEGTMGWEGSGRSKSEGPRRTPVIWEDGQCLIFGPMTHRFHSLPTYRAAEFFEGAWCYYHHFNGPPPPEAYVFPMAIKSKRNLL